MSLDRREKGHNGDERRVSFSLPRGKKATRRPSPERERAGNDSSQNEPPLCAESVLEDEGEIDLTPPAKHKKKWKIRLPWGKGKRQKEPYQYEFDETCPDCLEGTYEARGESSSSESDLEKPTKEENEQTSPTRPVSLNSASDSRSIGVDGETTSERHSTISVEVMENRSDSPLPTSRKPKIRLKGFRMMGRKNQDTSNSFSYDSSFEVDTIMGSKNQLDSLRKEKYSSKGYQQGGGSPPSQRNNNETESMEFQRQKLGKHFFDSKFVENLNCIDLAVANTGIGTHSGMKKSNSLPSFFKKKKKKKAVEELKKRPGSISETPKRESRTKAHNEKAGASDSVQNLSEVERPAAKSPTSSFPFESPFASGAQPSGKTGGNDTHKRRDSSPTQMPTSVDSCSKERKMDRGKPKFSTQFSAIDNPPKDSLKFIDYFNFKKTSPMTISRDKRAISDEFLTNESRHKTTRSLASFDLRIRRRSYEEMLNLLEDQMFDTLTDEESNDSVEYGTKTSFNELLGATSIQEAALPKRSSSSSEVEIVHEPCLPSSKKEPAQAMDKVTKHSAVGLHKPSEEPTADPGRKISSLKEERKSERNSEVATLIQPNPTKMGGKERHKKKRKKAKAKIDFSTSSNSSLDDRSDPPSRYRLPPITTFETNKGLKTQSPAEKEERLKLNFSSSEEDLPPDFPPPPVPESDPNKGATVHLHANPPEKAASLSSNFSGDPTNVTPLKEDSGSTSYHSAPSLRKDIDDSQSQLSPFARRINTEGKYFDSSNSIETYQNLPVNGLPKILGGNSNTLASLPKIVPDPDDCSNDDGDVFHQKEMIDLNVYYGTRNARITELVGEVNSLLKHTTSTTQLKDYSRTQIDPGTSLTTKYERDINVSEISLSESSKQRTKITDSQQQDYSLKAVDLNDENEGKEFSHKGQQTPAQMDNPLLNLIPRPYTEFSKRFNPIRLKSYPECPSKDPRELHDSSLKRYDSEENRQSEDSDMKMDLPVPYQYNDHLQAEKGPQRNQLISQFSSEMTHQTSTQGPGTTADSTTSYNFTSHREGNNDFSQTRFAPEVGYQTPYFETPAIPPKPPPSQNSLSDMHRSATGIARDLLTKKDTTKDRSFDIEGRNFSHLLTKPKYPPSSPSRMFLPPPPPPPRQPPKENSYSGSLSSLASNDPINKVVWRESYTSDKQSSLSKGPQRLGGFLSSRHDQEDPAGRYVAKVDTVRDGDALGSPIGIPLHPESDSGLSAFGGTLENLAHHEEYSHLWHHTHNTEAPGILTSHNPLPLPPREYGLKEQKRNIVTFNLPRSNKHGVSHTVSAPVSETYEDSSIERDEVPSETLLRMWELETYKKLQPVQHQILPISREQPRLPCQSQANIDESLMAAIDHRNSKPIMNPDNRRNNAPLEGACRSRPIDSSKDLSTVVPNRVTRRSPPLKGILRNTKKPIGSIRSQGEPIVEFPRQLMVSDTVNRSVFNSAVERIEISDTSDSSSESPPTLPSQPPPPACSIPQHQLEFLDNLLQSSSKSPRTNQVRPGGSYYVPTIVEGTGIRPELDSVYQAKRNSLLSFYGRAPTTTSGSLLHDEVEDESTCSSASSSGEEDDGVMRSYHIGPPPTSSNSSYGLGMSDGILATIAEDVEEDSGGESSGHWGFSADSTDTDSVIHVPPRPPLGLHSLPPATFFNPVGDTGLHSSSSEDTLICSEDEIVKISVKGTMATRSSANDLRPESSSVLSDREHCSRGTPLDQNESFLLSGNASIPEGSGQLSTDRPHGEVKLEEDFDFSSLESCEAISICSELEEGGSCRSDAFPKDDVFNTSATSQPFTNGRIKDEGFQSRGQNDARKISHDEKNVTVPHLTKGNLGVVGSSPNELDVIGWYKDELGVVGWCSDELGRVGSQKNELGHDYAGTTNSCSDAPLHPLIEEHNKSQGDKTRSNFLQEEDCIQREAPQPALLPPTLDNGLSETEAAVENDDLHRALSSSPPLSLSSSPAAFKTRQPLSSPPPDATQMPHHESKKGGHRPPGDLAPIPLSNAKPKSRRTHRPNNRLRTRAALRHPKSSDGDTDDTDGDCEDDPDEAPFLSGASRTEGTARMRGYQPSPPRNEGRDERKAELGEGSQPSKDVLFSGSSPEVPLSPHPGGDSCQTGATVSTTRSVETLSEDSGLGDQNYRLTSSSPLASIIEAVKDSTTAPPAVPHHRLVRPFSMGDLRYYSSDSDSDADTNRTRAFADFKMSSNVTDAKSRLNAPQYRDPYYYVQNKPLQFDSWDRNAGEEVPKQPQVPRRLAEKWNGVSAKPRRHQSMYEPNTASFPETWGAASPSYASSLQRPKPLSLDMAEEFMSQEGLESPVNSFNPYVTKNKGGSFLSETCFGNDNTLSSLVQDLPGYKLPNRDENWGGRELPVSSSKEYVEEVEVMRISNGASTPCVMDEVGWLSARVRRHAVPSHAQYSLESQSTVSPQRGNIEQSGGWWLDAPCPSISHDPSESVLVNSALAQEGSPSAPSNPSPKLLRDTRTPLSSRDEAQEQEDMNRIHTKTYGPHGEVEVYLARRDNHPDGSALPKGDGATPSPEQQSQVRGVRGVTFSPSVKEVNWRESYIEPDDSDYLFTQMEEKEVKRVKVVSSESPAVHRCRPTLPIENSDNFRATCSFVVRPSTNPPAPPPRINGVANEIKAALSPPATGGGEPHRSEDSSKPSSPPSTSPRTSTPIWQRLKLIKVGSPKGPRPKIPPKPTSLSPRSSDSEAPAGKGSSPSSPDSEGLSSPSSPEFRFKKIPTSPRFFSWGSKREKKSPTSKQPAKAPSPIASLSPPANQAGSEPQAENYQQGPVMGRPVAGVPERAVEGASQERPRHFLHSSEEDIFDRDSKELPAGEGSNWGPADHGEGRENGDIHACSGDFYNTREAILKPHMKSDSRFDEPTRNLPSTPGQHPPRTQGSPSTELEQDSSTGGDGKPPLPPPVVHTRGTPQQPVMNKARLVHARHQYLTQGGRALSLPSEAPPSCQPTPSSDHPVRRGPSIPAGRGRSAAERLKERFDRFSRATRAERERLARSTPDLPQMEESLRRQTLPPPPPRIDCCTEPPSHSAASPRSGSDGDARDQSFRNQGDHVTLDEREEKQVRSAAPHSRSSLRGRAPPNQSSEFDRLSQRARTRSVGLLETDLDTGASREFLSPQETNLDDLYQDLQNFLDTLPQVSLPAGQKEKTRAKSLLQLDAASSSHHQPPVMESSLTTSRPEDSRARSMEFLLDDDNRAAAKAPENELMKEGERKVSEAELRVRRSLQRLDVPEWMKSAPQQQGFLLRRRDYSTGSAIGGWSAFSSKTGSMTSLGSSRANTPTKVAMPTRASTRSYGGITSPSSTTSISPSPSERAGGLFPYPLSRWSTSRINSGTTTPTGSLSSQRGVSATPYGRQPYLGWRSNTSLVSLGGSQSSLTAGAYLSPSERLALSLLQSKRQLEKDSVSTGQLEMTVSTPQCAVVQPTVCARDVKCLPQNAAAQVPDVHSSIKEVTSAIVHYCKDTSPRQSPRASPNLTHKDTSPRKFVWVESSFVGSRPINSPETPTGGNTPLSPAVNGHQEELVETRQPQPQPPDEASLFNSFSSTGSYNIRDGGKDSTVASTNDSTAVLPDSSRADSGKSFDESCPEVMEMSQNTPRNGRFSSSENSSRCSNADTINSTISSRGIDSLNSRNSAGSSTSGQSSGGKGEVSIREELDNSKLSYEDMTDEDTVGFKNKFLSRNIFSVTEDSTLTASCCSSFGIFQIEDETVPLTSKPKLTEKLYKLPMQGIVSSRVEETKESSHLRRFSDGPSPWEANPLASFRKKTRALDNTWYLEKADPGYGFNFSSFGKQTTALLQDESTSEDVGTESTTLEDVLDSLLALPSASRSPSPLGSAHPLSRTEIQPTIFPTKEEKPNKSEFKASPSKHGTASGVQFVNPGREDVRYTFMENHDNETDPKTETYHKSFTSYTSSTFVPSQPAILHSSTLTTFDSKNNDSLPTFSSDKTPVTFFLGKAEGNVTNSSAKQGFVNHSFASTPEMENAFSVDHFERGNFSSSIADTFLTYSLGDDTYHAARTSQPLTTFCPSPSVQLKHSANKHSHSNLTNPLGLNSSSGRALQETRRAPALEEGHCKAQNSSFPLPPTSVIKEQSDPSVKEPKVTFHLPPKHMNIPPDSSSENGNGSENMRVEMDDEDDLPSSSEPSGMLIPCRNTSCSNSSTIEEAKVQYKTCHNCSVFYCSRSCRRIHWDKHKHLCEKIKASSVARRVINRTREDPSVLEVMSSVARRGILTNGRGAVKIFFADTTKAEAFVANGSTPEAHYQPLQNIMPQEMGSETYKKVIEQCRSYNPSLKFILYVSICTFSETPSMSSQKCRRETIAKCAKLRLSDIPLQPNATSTPKGAPVEHHVITRDLNEPDTLVLAALPNSNYGLPPRQAREVAFSNIVRELTERGVDLRLQHADVYRKLSYFVDVGGSFPPITIYPKDTRRVNSFMCIIMPDADPVKLQRIGADTSKVRTIDVSKPHPPVT